MAKEVTTKLAPDFTAIIGLLAAAAPPTGSPTVLLLFRDDDVDD